MLAISPALLLGTRDSLNHRVNPFEVAGIGRHGNIDLIPLGGIKWSGRPQVIFNIA